jgi:hypothetical protein
LRALCTRCLLLLCCRSCCCVVVALALAFAPRTSHLARAHAVLCLLSVKWCAGARKERTAVGGAIARHNGGRGAGARKERTAVGARLRDTMVAGARVRKRADGGGGAIARHYGGRGAGARKERTAEKRCAMRRRLHPNSNDYEHNSPASASSAQRSLLVRRRHRAMQHSSILLHPLLQNLRNGKSSRFREDSRVTSHLTPNTALFIAKNGHNGILVLLQQWKKKAYGPSPLSLAHCVDQPYGP